MTAMVSVMWTKIKGAPCPSYPFTVSTDGLGKVFDDMDPGDEVSIQRLDS